MVDPQHFHIRYENGDKDVIGEGELLDIFKVMKREIAQHARKRRPDATPAAAKRRRR